MTSGQIKPRAREWSDKVERGRMLAPELGVRGCVCEGALGPVFLPLSEPV